MILGNLRNRTCALALLATALAGATTARASSITVFQGTDAPLSPGGATPNSDAAAAQFNTAAVIVQSINFEGLSPTGPFSSFNIAPGVSMTSNNLDPSFSGLSTDNTHGNQGFNTTSGGSEFFRFTTPFNALGSVDFNFTTPINAWGAYFSGLESPVGASINVQFSDGTTQTLQVSRSASAGVSFFGFTDAGATISKVSIVEDNTGLSTRDIFGIDDVRYSQVLVPTGPSGPSAVPLPAAAWGGAALLGALGMNKARRRRLGRN